METNYNRESTKMSFFKSITLLYILVQITTITQINAYRHDSYYDPENQDGIPVMSSKNGGPAIKWQYDDGDNIGQALPTNQVQRRNSDADLEDGLEEDDDDDRDEYKSGSSNHDSYENPAFGESRRAAQDGQDIENFFDKHIGPQEAMESSPDDDVPVNGVTSRSDSDDRYEAAASSPLSTIFHSLLNAHKRPFVIHTTDDSSSSDDQQPSTGSSMTVSSPVRGATNIEPATPIAYFGPIAAPSTVTSYEQSSLPVSDSNSNQDEFGPVREIYIARRPSIVNHFQPYSHSSRPMVHQSSNAHWRGSMAARPYGEQLDYMRYPVAASYAYQREQQSPPEEEQIVSYGLSFGRGTDELEANPGDQNSVDEPTYAPPNSKNLLRHSSSTRSYNNYNYPPSTPAAPSYVRVQGSSGVMQQAPYHGARYHKDPSESAAQPVNYGQYRSGLSNAAPRAKDNNQYVATRQQLLASLDKQIKTNQYYQQNANNMRNIPMKQQPYYAQPTNSRSTAKEGSGDGSQTDLDTYSSFHSEIDPYKSFITSSRIVSEPVGVDNTLQSGSSSVPLNMDVNQTNLPASNLTQYNDTNQHFNLLTGPVTNVNDNSVGISAPTINDSRQTQANLRVRRDDSDERENEDADDDGVWVDDDEDDDNNKQSSDLSETSQEPEEEDSQQEVSNPGVGSARGQGVIGAPHSYELSPEDLLVYHG